MSVFEIGFKEFTDMKGLKIKKMLTPRVALLEGGRVLKQTGDKAEISAAKKLVGVDSKYWANIYTVDEFFNGNLAYITVELVDRLSHLQGAKIFNMFMRRLNWKIIVCYIVYYLTFKTVKLNIRKMFFNKYIKSWIDRAYEIKTELQKHGIENPSDYFCLDNLGFKDGKLVAFDIRDEKDLFYDLLK